MRFFSIKVSKFFSILCIFLLGIVVYSQTFQHSFHFDDYAFIVNNPAIKDVSRVGLMWDMLSQPSRFVGFLSFAVNYHFHQLDVLGYHVTNLVIHLMNALLVWWLVGMIVRSLNRVQTPEVCMRYKTAYKPRGFVHGSTVALCAALIFVCHPVQTQAVTYIAQRMASLATLFYLLSVCLYIKGRGVETRLIASVHFFGAALAAVLGMFTKEIVITLPLAIILVELTVNEPRRFGNPNLRGSFTVLLLFCLIIPALFSFNFSGLLFAPKISASHEGEVITFGKYFFTQARVFVTFLKLAVFPIGQNFDYDFALSQSLFERATLLSFALLAVLLGVAVKIRRRYSLVAFGLFWFFLTLAPNLIPRRHIIYEHKLYLAMVGFAIVVSVGLHHLIKNRKQFIVTMLIILGLFSYLTIQRNKVWKDDITLWTDVIQKSPHKSRAHHNLGYAYMLKGEDDVAIEYFTQSLKLNPKYFKAHTSLGQVYARKKDYDKALMYYSNGLKLNPSYAQGYANRGIVYKDQGQLGKALFDLNKALELDVYLTEAYVSRGVVFFMQNQAEKALQDFDKAIQIDPQFSAAHYNRKLVLKQLIPKPLNNGIFSETKSNK